MVLDSEVLNIGPYLIRLHYNNIQTVLNMILEILSQHAPDLKFMARHVKRMQYNKTVLLTQESLLINSRCIISVYYDSEVYANSSEVIFLLTEHPP